MITLEDCIGLCGLTEEEVLAIAEHEHLPEIAATALGQYLLSLEHGTEKVRDIIVHDIRQSQLSGRDKEHVLILLHVLHHFLKTHPEARPSVHPWSKATTVWHQQPADGRKTRRPQAKSYGQEQVSRGDFAACVTMDTRSRHSERTCLYDLAPTFR